MGDKEREEGTKIVVKGVPKELKNRFKAMCAKDGTTMKRVIILSMEKYADLLYEED